VTHRNGLLVRNFKDRYTPPLQFYFIAPFIGLLGESSFVCRLPFALCGVVTVGIIVAWLRKARPPAIVWWAAVIIVLTNAEFFLFFRQCRYYGLATVLTAAVGYFYCNRGQSLARTWGLSIVLALLLAAQYLDYAAVIGCLIVDYAIWGRRQPLGFRRWLVILVPQVVVGVVILSIWNPLAPQIGEQSYHSQHLISDRLHLIWWNFRDLNACDFAILPLVIACPIVYFKTKSQWILRAPLALCVFVGAMGLAVPTSVARAHTAEVRYLAPAIPLCMGVGILAVWGLISFNRLSRWAVLLIALGSILIEPSPGEPSRFFGSTALLYYHELAIPQQESYAPVIDWINANVPAGESIYVQPIYKSYPLMFRASKAVYAWQLGDDQMQSTRPDFAGLPDIHFWGRVAPDYLIRFGTNGESAGADRAREVLASRDIDYQLVATLPLQWKDFYRPERIWRSFVTVPPKQGEEVYIYRKEENR
jgi:4-amino-4-deoxy-L-arabinose transferase-like glycosyltransferase